VALELITDLPDGLRKSGAIEVRKRFEYISGGDVLDVGTQKGDFIKALMKLLKEYKTFTGIDISEDNLKAARKRFKDDPVELLLMNAESMTFPDNQFDTVCISYSIHHLKKIDRVLSEMYRVLKPSGYFIVQEMYRDGEQSKAQQVDTLVHHFDAKVDSLLGIPHFKTLTRQRLRKHVRKLGLRDVKTFDSTWSVNCLFCSDAHDCENPKRAEHIDSIIKQIDDTLSKVRQHPSYVKLREEGESIKERVRAEGSADASVMYFFGKK
jgi:ubiquinone/menaquinone biosynthesis C-methylase UbiE